jgi:L-asparaginase
MKLLIINTGGTFTKQYSEIVGSLVVPKNNYSIKILTNEIFKNNVDFKIRGTIHKDSLEITSSDRKKLVLAIQNEEYTKIIIIHGTDTIDLSAKYLDEHIKDKEIILTGAIKPFSISQVEATANFAIAYGFLLNNQKNGIYISMHGIIEDHKNIYKDRQLGIFRRKNSNV